MSDAGEKEGKKSPAQGVFSIYWELYGGLPALVSSIYFISAIVVTVICAPFWMNPVEAPENWTELTFTIVPSLMGFSLGGMAILLSFSNNNLLRAIRQNGKKDSVFMKSVSSFFHFILIQSMALIAAIISKWNEAFLFSFIGFFLLVYGMLVAVAAAGMLLQFARVLNRAAVIDDPSDRKAGEG